MSKKHLSFQYWKDKNFIIEEMHFCLEKSNFSKNDISFFSAKRIGKKQLEIISSQNKKIKELYDSNLLKSQCDIEGQLDFYFLNVGLMCTNKPVTIEQALDIINTYYILLSYEFFKALQIVLNISSEDRKFQDVYIKLEPYETQILFDSIINMERTQEILLRANQTKKTISEVL